MSTDTRWKRVAHALYAHEDATDVPDPGDLDLCSYAETEWGAEARRLIVALDALGVTTPPEPAPRLEVVAQEARCPDCTPTPAPVATAAVRQRIVGTWLVEEVNHHTCGTRPGGHFGAHEPGCGLVPVVDLSTLPGWPTEGPQPTDRLIDHDAVTVARREALDLDHADPEMRRLAVATIRQALHEMELADPAIGDYCPRITRKQGRLSERYVGTSTTAMTGRHDR